MVHAQWPFLKALWKHPGGARGLPHPRRHRKLPNEAPLGDCLQLENDKRVDVFYSL